LGGTNTSTLATDWLRHVHFLKLLTCSGLGSTDSASVHERDLQTWDAEADRDYRTWWMNIRRRTEEHARWAFQALGAGVPANGSVLASPPHTFNKTPRQEVSGLPPAATRQRGTCKAAQANQMTPRPRQAERREHLGRHLPDWRKAPAASFPPGLPAQITTALPAYGPRSLRGQTARNCRGATSRAGNSGGWATSIIPGRTTGRLRERSGRLMKQILRPLQRGLGITLSGDKPARDRFKPAPTIHLTWGAGLRWPWLEESNPLQTWSPLK